MSEPIDHGHAPFSRGTPERELGDITDIENPMTHSQEGLKPFPHTSEFAGDDGSTPEALVAAYAQTDSHRLSAIVAALADSRVLIPVVAKIDKMEEPEYEGQIVGDKESHAAMVTVAAPDGRAALPVFSSTTAMAQWREDSRPVPVNARRAALAAATEADSLLVLDPGTENATLIPASAVAAIAKGEQWRSALFDDEVHQAIARIVESIPAAVRAEVQPGKDAEIRIVLALRPGLDKVAVINASNHMSAALGSTPIITERVDSLELSITTAKE